MCDPDPGLGHELAQVLGDELDVLHLVVHEEDLALAEQLAADGLGDGTIVVLADVGEDRLALLGWRVHQRQIADAGERQLERPRDRCRRQRQHVHAGTQALDLLLVEDAEALLLVDHEQTEILEHDVAGEQAVGPDHDIDVTGGDPRDDGVLLLRREEA